MTPSLSGFISSLFIGTALVIIPIGFALATVSRIDPLEREEV
jgi:hypothetical protein